MRCSVGTEATPWRYFSTILPICGLRRSFSDGIVTIRPPAMSSASLAISYGMRVTFCLQTLASRRSISKLPDAVLWPSHEHEMPHAYSVSLRWVISMSFVLDVRGLGGAVVVRRERRRADEHVADAHLAAAVALAVIAGETLDQHAGEPGPRRT